MEGDAESGLSEHLQVVGAIAHGNSLCEMHPFHLCNEPEQFCLSVAVDNLAYVSSRELAVVTHLQFVGIHIVYAVLALQELAEIGKSSAEYGNLIPASLQNGHQPVHTLRDRHGVGDILHDACVKSLQQGHPACEALLEVYLAPHGALRNSPYLSTHSGPFGKLVDTFCLYERGVHIEAYQSAHAAVHVVFLEREVYLHLR